MITVEYLLDGTQKTETYAVTNYDNQAPNITADAVQKSGDTYYVGNIQVTDNGKIKKIKFIDTEVPSDNLYDFFKTNGYDLLGNKIKLESEDANYTIYAEDYAGNYSAIYNNNE